MNTRDVRGWLLLQPRPSSLRIIAADQSPHKFEITQGMRWIEAAESVLALQPELIEALDEKGNLLRAVRPEDVTDPDEEEVNVSLNQDPENARLITFAKLLADAYRHSTDVAFEKLVALFDAVNRRGEQLEKSLAAMERLQRKALAEAVEEGAAEPGSGTFEETLMGAFLQGQAQKAAREREESEAANGKKEVPK